MQVDFETQPHSMTAQCRQLDKHLGDHAQGVADGQDDQCLVPCEQSAFDHQRVQHERRDGDDVVHHGGGIGGEIVALRVEHTRNHRGHAIQDDLESEEAEEPYRKIEIEIRARARRLCPDDRTGEYEAQNREDAHNDEQDGEQIRGVLGRRLTAAIVADGEVNRQK